MQEADQTLRTACEQRHACNLRTAYTDEHFSQQKAVFLQLPASSHLASLQSPTSSGRQINSSRRQPANASRRRSSFLTEQISSFRSPATFTFTNFVKNPRLKSRASDKKQKPLFVGLCFVLICFLLHLPDALPAGFSLTQALCQDPYPGSPTAVQALKVDFHHGSHASPRYRCFIVWLFPSPECLFACDRF